ncbi:hypothetical protein ACMD2_19477 [Ananas comosus]|uniref:C2H2-type domain-containing protein n=1 Tax=Ananas comosus TaxID=4615 RepID=A0A199VTW6_ANACO|nr:hypothetical protein ACMD2_19477 [Ananas comosus]
MKRIKETQKLNHQEPESPSYREALRNLFTCRSRHRAAAAAAEAKNKKNGRRIGCSGSLCNLKDDSRIMQKPERDASPEPVKRRASVSSCNVNERSTKKPLGEANRVVSTSSSSHSSASSTSSIGGSFRGMHLRRLSGCYECHMVIDPINGLLRDSSLRATIFSCPDCGEIFVKSDSLEVHQSIRHAVSELGTEDTSRNIVEIIFQSSWLKKQAPICKIDRILKVHNTQKTKTKFEDYRECIKNKASKLSKKYPRCIADGNELLRFHCTTIKCSLGLHGSTNLCDSIPQCSVCSIIRDGFKTDKNGRIVTMATSGRAHDNAKISLDDERRAMLLCRVIAGRVKRNQDSVEEYDSVAGTAGVYSNLDELFVFNPKAILPCFVVIYRG